MSLEIGPASILYQRISYDCIGIAKDIGGLTNVLLVMFSLLIYPMANYSFFLRAIKRLYFAKTSDKKLFEFYKKKHNHIFQNFYEKYDCNLTDFQISKLRIIDFSNFDSFCLFLAN
jgi:hypothetical protein